MHPLIKENPSMGQLRGIGGRKNPKETQVFDVIAGEMRGQLLSLNNHLNKKLN